MAHAAAATRSSPVPRRRPFAPAAWPRAGTLSRCPSAPSQPTVRGEHPPPEEGPPAPPVGLLTRCTEPSSSRSTDHVSPKGPPDGPRPRRTPRRHGPHRQCRRLRSRARPHPLASCPRPRRRPRPQPRPRTRPRPRPSPRVHVEVDTDVAARGPSSRVRPRRLPDRLSSHGRERVAGSVIGSTACDTIERARQVVVVAGPLVVHSGPGRTPWLRRWRSTVSSCASMGRRGPRPGCPSLRPEPTCSARSSH